MEACAYQVESKKFKELLIKLVLIVKSHAKKMETIQHYKLPDPMKTIPHTINSQYFYFKH